MLQTYILLYSFPSRFRQGASTLASLPHCSDVEMLKIKVENGSDIYGGDQKHVTLYMPLMNVWLQPIVYSAKMGSYEFFNWLVQLQGNSLLTWFIMLTLFALCSGV